MKISKHLLFASLFISTALLNSCASYKASPLCNLSPDLIESHANSDVFAVAKKYSSLDCQKFLDRDVIIEGYQPVQVYIQNNSDNAYILSLNRLSLPVARPEEVADKVHTSTVGRVTGYAIGALIVWPLVIPAIVDGIGSSKANIALDVDFLAKAAKDQLIFPHSHINALIFVPNSAYQDNFSITLLDQESKQPKTLNLVSRE